MTDRYEEFKIWINGQLKGSVFLEQIEWTVLFSKFEEEQSEKQKEEEIKELMMKIIAKTPLDERDLEYNGKKVGTAYCSNRVVDKIYNTLKEKDLIK